MTQPVLTVDAKVICPHGGTATVKASQSTLVVAGRAVLVADDLNGSKIDHCVPPPGVTACASVQTTTGGTAALLGVGGAKVLLSTAGGATDTGALWTVAEPGQTRLVAS